MTYQLGNTYALKALSQSDKGYWLEAGEREILLPNKWVPKGFKKGDTLEVFLYRDSEDRPSAIPLKPLAGLGECAPMRITDVTAFGAFAEWGLPKDLLIPRSEQLKPLKEGDTVLVKVLFDESTDRLIGTTRILDTLIRDTTGLRGGQEVLVHVVAYSELGYRAVVNHKYLGLFYSDDLPEDVQVGLQCTAYIKKIRTDGKLDLSPHPLGFVHANPKARQEILEALKRGQGFLPFHDQSDPEEIKNALGMSKKTFKVAIGTLYKERIIAITPEGIRLINESVQATS